MLIHEILFNRYHKINSKNIYLAKDIKDFLDNISDKLTAVLPNNITHEVTLDDSLFSNGSNSHHLSSHHPTSYHTTSFTMKDIFQIMRNNTSLKRDENHPHTLKNHEKGGKKIKKRKTKKRKIKRNKND